MEIKLTNRELDVINVLWKTNNPLTAKEIADTNYDLSINTVQAILKKLLKKDLVCVSGIVYSGTVLTRSYKAVLTFDEYVADQFLDRISMSTDNILVALVKKEKNELEAIDKLENLLKQYRKKLEKD